MAIAVSQAFKDAWLTKSWKAWRREVRIKRRYWNGAAFAIEASWQTLRQDQVKRVPQIPQEVDSEFGAIFQISEFAIEVASPNGEFVVDKAPPSFFAADNVGTDGYEAIRSEIEVVFVLTLQNGTEESAVLFSGIIIDDPVLNPESLTASIPVASNAQLIADSDAEKVSDAVTLENCSPATGNGTNTQFKTTSKGVAAVTDLQKAAASLTQGRNADWTVDKVGEDVPAEFEIHSSPPPQTGQTMKWSGRTWKQNLSVDSLANLVLDNAGFPSGKREIAPITYPGTLSGFKRVDTQAEWESASLRQNISTLAKAGFIKKQWHRIDEFADGDYTLNPVWTVQASAGAASAAASAGLLNLATTSGGAPIPQIGIATAFTKTVGTWSQRVRVNSLSSNFAGYVVNVFAVDAMFISGGNLILKGYGLYFFRDGSVTLKKYDGQTLDSGTVIASCGTFTAGVYERWNVSRDADGNFKVYKDGALVGSGSETFFQSRSYYSLTATSSGSSGGISVDITDIAYSEEINAAGAISLSAAVYESQEFDLLAAPSAWGALDFTETLNGGTITYETTVASAAGGPYDAWTAIAASTRAIQSALKRYLKVRASIAPASGSFASPEVDFWKANFSTSNIFITVANLSGLDADNGGGWAAIERYVGPTGYAMGLRGNGNFFLKRKDDVSEAVASLTQDNCLKRLLEFDHGAKRVRNVGRTRYADYVAEYDGAAAGEAAPTSEKRFGRKVKERNLDAVIFANDLNLGQAQARTDYEQLYRRKRRWRFQCYFVPWLELLDRAKITFLRDPLAASQVYGDALMERQPYDRFQTWGVPNFLPFVKEQLCRILAWAPDPDQHDESILYVEEILNA